MGMKLGGATLRRDRRQAIAVSEFPENLGGLLVADSTGLMVAMQYIAERKSLRKNLHNNICQQWSFFALRESAHLSMCKPLKHAALLHPLNRSLLFSTLFFTELLKRSRNYWKQICAVIIRETSQQNKSPHAVEWFSLTHAK
jgi:hypothetical protein